MSGHSKWAQIKRQKGVADVKRGQTFTKLANAITIAVRDGGGVTDPEQNFKLRLTIEKAREVNMPKENIQRAIDRGSGRGDKGDQLQEAVYEGFAPGGVSVIIEAVTDNKLRTTSQIKSAVEKLGGTIATPGAVSYQFETRGLIVVEKGINSIDDIFLFAVDNGATDVEDTENEVLIYTKPEELKKVKDALSQKFSVTSAELIREPSTRVFISDKDTADRILAFMERIESLDDIQKVYANFDIPDSYLTSHA